MRASRPSCTPKHLSCEAAPPYWFQFYQILFRELHHRDLTYVQAVAEVAGGFLDWAMALLCGLFLLGAFLIVYDRDSLNAEGVIGGETFASMLGVVRFLRGLWLEKSTVDMLILASMSPAESAKLVTSFYFKSVQGKEKTAAGRA